MAVAARAGRGSERRVLASNRRARYDYDIVEKLVAGLVLTGPEVKSCKLGRASLAGAYVEQRGGELFVVSMKIAKYENARSDEPLDRPRKLLVHKREAERVAGKISAKGLTAVPLALLEVRGFVKLELGLGRGRRKYEKRRAILEREAKRELREGS